MTGAVVAQIAVAQLRVPPPVVATGPPASAHQLVGFATWLWAEPRSWRPVSATAAVGTITATIVASPVTLLWSPGDGANLDCRGPGTPWHPGATATSCSHTFVTDGAMAGAVREVWRLTWSASDGTGGQLPDVTSSAPLPLTVIQVQAVTS